MNAPSRTTFPLALALLVLLAPVTHALIFVSTSDPNFNTTPPGGALTNSGWQWQGAWGEFLGTPIGPHHFITAAHVGGSITELFRLNGVDYQPVATFADPEADLRIWQINGTFPSYAPMYRGSNEVGRPLVVFGRGAGRGAEVLVTNGATMKVQGWRWGANDGRLRWGENIVTEIQTEDPGIGSLLRVAFDATAGVNEAHLAGGDSSGAVFIQEAGVWKLAGMNYAVDSAFSHSSSGEWFAAALFDMGGLFVGDSTNWQLVANRITDIPSAFYATRISRRAAWIDCVLTNTAGTDSPLRLLSTQRMGTDLAVQFTTMAGCRYQLQSSDTLQDGSWVNRGGAITGTGNPMTALDAGGGTASRRFYRIRVLY